MPDAHEVELKFLCAPQDLEAVLALAPAGVDDSRELISVYFDTPDEVLRKAGATLRVRESRGRRVQTLKRGDGLRREEHEQDIEGLRPDPDVGPLREILPEGAEALRPAFNVRITRRQRTLRYQGAEIELALDSGEVADGARTRPISEVELELKSGAPAALFALARELAGASPLYLSFASKAAQGRALAAGEPRPRSSGDRVRLPKRVTVGAAFQLNARDALTAMAAGAAILREGPDTEATHQLRVAVRRLRSAMTTFKPVIADPDAARLKQELRWLAKASDAARELDVLARTLLDPALTPQPPSAALEEAVTVARRGAQRQLCDVLAGARFRTLMVDLFAWVETGAWLIGAPAQQPARAFAAKAMTKRRKAVLKKGKGLEAASDAARHHLRIAAKKLRYAAEGFSGLFSAKPARRLVRDLKSLQDGLGALNDAAVAEPLIARLNLPPEPAFEAGKRLGVMSCGSARHLAEARAALDRMADASPYWR